MPPEFGSTSAPRPGWGMADSQTSGQPVQWGPPQDHAACNEAIAAAGRNGAREALLSLAAWFDRKERETAAEVDAHRERDDDDAAIMADGARSTWRDAARKARLRAGAGSDGDTGAVPVSPDTGQAQGHTSDLRAPERHPVESRVDFGPAIDAAIAKAETLNISRKSIDSPEMIARLIAAEVLRVATPAIAAAVAASHGAPLPPADRGWRENVTCGSCGYAFGTNCDENDMDCPECEARRCPCCGNWFGGTDDA